VDLDRRIHVVGASGIEGSAVLLYLAGERCIEGIVAHDFSADRQAFEHSFHKTNTAWSEAERGQVLERLWNLPISFQLGSEYLRGIETAELIFASQNWFNYEANRPAMDNAVAAGAQLVGVLDLALDLFSGRSVTVTGSNGKSTTAALIGHLLQASVPAGSRVMRSGNDRSEQAALAALERASSADLAVWEVSNRHLRDRTVVSDVAVLTNITHNHIEDHGSWQAYVAAKSRLVLAPGQGGHAVLSAVDPQSRKITEAVRDSGATLWLFGAPPQPGSLDGACWVEDGLILLREPQRRDNLELARASDLPLPGEHNLLNLQAALCATAACGFLDRDVLRSALCNAPGLPGRLELVAEQAEVRWVYDIQATTAPAAAAGIEAIAASGTPIVLLVGGEDKGMDFTEMANAAASSSRRILALPGTGTDALLASLADRAEVEHCTSLDHGLERARAIAQPGDTVLLSPGCAFFYRHYIDGGPSFTERVRRMLGLDYATPHTSEQQT